MPDATAGTRLLLILICPVRLLLLLILLLFPRWLLLCYFLKVDKFGPVIQLFVPGSIEIPFLETMDCCDTFGFVSGGWDVHL